MLHMIFEDNPDFYISNFLKLAYASLDVKLHFCNGNTSFKSYLKSVYNSKDLYILYYDLIPDNLNTMVYYRNLVNYITNGGGKKNICLVPIYGIEYYVLKAFDRCPEPLEAIHMYDRSLNMTSTLEKYYKHLLNENPKMCLRPNKPITAFPMNARFYTEGCKCCLGSFNCEEFTLRDKAKLLIQELPIYWAIGSFSKPTKYVEAREVVLTQSSMYNSVVKEVIPYLNPQSVRGRDLFLDCKKDIVSW